MQQHLSALVMRKVGHMSMLAVLHLLIKVISTVITLWLVMARYDGAHNSWPSDQPPSPDEKQKPIQPRGRPKKTIVIKNSCGVGGRKLPSEGRFSGRADKSVGVSKDTEKWSGSSTEVSAPTADT